MPPPHRPSHRPTPLPPYEPPTHPLTPTAQRALQALPQTHPLTRLKRHLDIATTSLTDLAGEVNDRYWQRAEYMRRRRVRRAGQGHEGAEEERETETERMRGEVEGMTVRMEVSVRGVIDARVHVEGTERALGEVVGNVVAGNGTVAGTQSTLGASQFRGWRGGRRRRRMRGRAGDEGEEEEEGSEFEEEEGAATQDQDGQENVGPVELLRKKMEEHKVRYEGLPLRARYATNNSYIGFKRIVHDALHPGDDAPPLPNASTWFPAEGSLHPSSNTRTRARADDEDDDLAIASERISIKCPLTLLPYKDPVTSTKCPHSFEKAAILDMISRSAGRVGGEKAVKCPVCETMLTPTTLHPDPILLRKIARIQAAEARRADDDETYSSEQDHNADEHATHRRAAAEIVDDGEDDGDGDAVTGARRLGPRVKAERMASLAPGMGLVQGAGGGGSGGEGQGQFIGTQTVTERGAVVVDLGEGEEDEEEEGDVDEGEDSYV